MKKLVLVLVLFFGAATLMKAQYIRPERIPYYVEESTIVNLDPDLSFYRIPDLTENFAEEIPDFSDALAMKNKGRALLITGGALSLTGIALYLSAYTMISDSTSIGGVFSIGGLVVFTSAIPCYITGSIYYVKGRKACLAASPGKVALIF